MVTNRDLQVGGWSSAALPPAEPRILEPVACVLFFLSPTVLCKVWVPPGVCISVLGLAQQLSHKLGGLEPQKSILPQLPRPEVQNPGAGKAGSSGLSGGPLLGPLPASGGCGRFLAFLGLRPRHPDLCPIFTWLSPCMSLAFPLKTPGTLGRDSPS